MRPTPCQISATRRASGLTQSSSAELVHVTLRAWQMWESGDRAMPGAAWELYLIKTNQQQAE